MLTAGVLVIFSPLLADDEVENGAPRRIVGGGQEWMPKGGVETFPNIATSNQEIYYNNTQNSKNIHWNHYSIPTTLQSEGSTYHLLGVSKIPKGFKAAPNSRVQHVGEGNYAFYFKVNSKVHYINPTGNPQIRKK